MNNSSKIVYSIGLGPGEPELITVKAKRILEESQVVVVPQSDKTGRSIARDIVMHYVDYDKILMSYFPMNNDKEELTKRYEALALKIKGLVFDDNKQVSYVTLGEPTIFSTSNYLTDKLYVLGVEVRHVPGISAINAASSRLGLPLCVKGENFGVYELPQSVDETVMLINRHSSTVFMKVNKRLDVLKDAVKTAMPKEAYLIKRVGLEDEEICNLLEDKQCNELAYLAVAVVKKGAQDFQ